MEKINNSKIRTLTIDKKYTRDEKYFKLTDNQWTVYYYLLSISRFNKEEMHRYIYKNSFSITETSKRLGISKQTFYNSLATLKKRGLIVIMENWNYYVIPNVYEDFADIKLYILEGLLAIRKFVGIDLLRTYLIFTKIQELDKRTIKTFTRRNIVDLLGNYVNEKMNYYRVECYIAILSSWGLIEVEEKKIISQFGGITGYVLKKVNLDSSKLKTFSQEISTEVNIDNYYEGLPNNVISQIKNFLVKTEL